MITGLPLLTSGLASVSFIGAVVADPAPTMSNTDCGTLFSAVMTAGEIGFSSAVAG